jgi:hypothetical protein
MPLKRLIERCWAPEPSTRPSFTEILNILDAILVDVLVEDKNGQDFWKSNFLGKDHVAWSDFVRNLVAFMKIPAPISKDLTFRCLKTLLAEPNVEPNAKDRDMVKLEKFGHWCNWFGPLECDQTMKKSFCILVTKKT